MTVIASQRRSNPESEDFYTGLPRPKGLAVTNKKHLNDKTLSLSDVIDNLLQSVPYKFKSIAHFTPDKTNSGTISSNKLQSAKILENPPVAIMYGFLPPKLDF